jgi:FMN phosphatase YigB (HAD superfamily)
LSPAQFPFTLITTYENMHATKARPAYYAEIADRICRAPEDCLMVGDNWKWDVVNALEVGMSAFWIAAPERDLPDPSVALVGRGTLQEFSLLAEGFESPAG